MLLAKFDIKKKIVRRRIRDKVKLGRKGDPLKIVQEVKIWAWLHKQESLIENETNKILRDFEIKKDSPNSF